MAITQQSINESYERAEGSLFINRAISSHFGSCSCYKNPISPILRNMGYPERSILSMELCGQETQDLGLINCPNCGTRSFTIRWRCNLRTCPSCSQIRRMRIIDEYLPYLASYKPNHLYGLSFITISPKNYDSLEEGYKNIRQTFSKAIRRKYLKQRIKAGIYVIETKENWVGKKQYDKKGNYLYTHTKKSYNIHIHGIIYSRRLDNHIRGKCLDCGQNLIKYDGNGKYYCASRRCKSTNVIFKKNSKLVDIFSSCANRDVHVHITDKAVDSRTGVTFYTKNNPEFCLNYMLKYVTADKEEFENDYSLAEYIVQTRRMKLISKFGLFFSVKPEKKKLKCLVCGAEVSFTIDFQLIKIMSDIKSRPPSLLEFGFEHFMECSMPF